MEFPQNIPTTGTRGLIRLLLMFGRYGRSLNCSGVQKGITDMAYLVPNIDTGAVAQSMAVKAVKNLSAGMVSVKTSEVNTSTEPTMYLCLLLHLFMTDATVKSALTDLHSSAYRSPRSRGDSGALQDVISSNQCPRSLRPGLTSETDNSKRVLCLENTFQHQRHH